GADAQIDQRRQPDVDQVRFEGLRVREALHRVRAELEEQRAVDERRFTHAAPEQRALLLDRKIRQRGEQIALLLLDSADDLGEQTFPRAEVVYQHPMTGADRGRDTAQARVPDAVL